MPGPRASAADATRFTSTGPYAGSKFAGSQFAGRSTIVRLPEDGGKVPEGETPAQKIARLRAMADKQKMLRNEMSTFDKVILRGRVWADRAHRFTVYCLLGLGGMAVVLGAVSIVDMAIYSRQKRLEYDQANKLAYQTALHNAIAAKEAGVASEEALELIRHDAEVAAAEKEFQEQPSLWARTKMRLFGNLRKEESVGGRIGERSAGVVVPEGSPGAKKIEPEIEWEGVQDPELRKEIRDRLRDEIRGQGSLIVKAVETARRDEALAKKMGTSAPKPEVGGQLDQMGENAAQAAKDTAEAAREKGKSWVDWMMRR